jgi:hypothetical protein
VFGELQGCTGDGRYCAHMTIIDPNTWKIWVKNVDVGCSQEFLVQYEPILGEWCESGNYIDGSAC